VAGLDSELQGGFVRDSRPVAAGDGHAPLLGQIHQLGAAAVHQNHPDAQGAQNRQIQQEVSQVGGGRHLTIEGDHKNLFAETRDVLEDAS
jgi:hypothetical protein